MEHHWIETPCPRPSAAHADQARARQLTLTKPPGSLGRLEEIAVALSALQATERPQADNVVILLFAGDHGVTAQGISAFPSDVTVEMLKNFAAGGAAISVLADELAAPLMLVDAGTCAIEPIEGVIVDKPRNGTADFSHEPAMSEADLDHALATGREHANDAAGRSADILLLGEMGIGNTTSATAIACALLNMPASSVTGAGTGLEPIGIRHKADVITRALDHHGLAGEAVDPLKALRCVGGLEIAALTGAILASAQARLPVLIDGFIVTTAALSAVRINPSCRPWLLFAHRSAEQGHRHILDALDANPLLDLEMRLGEGSGAAVALSVIRSALSLHAKMATFTEAEISGPKSE